MTNWLHAIKSKYRDDAQGWLVPLVVQHSLTWVCEIVTKFPYGAFAALYTSWFKITRITYELTLYWPSRKIILKFVSMFTNQYIIFRELLCDWAGWWNTSQLVSDFWTPDRDYKVKNKFINLFRTFLATLCFFYVNNSESTPLALLLILPTKFLFIIKRLSNYSSIVPSSRFGAFFPHWITVNQFLLALFIILTTEAQPQGRETDRPRGEPWWNRHVGS